MDYLQYDDAKETLNGGEKMVLNLIINGLPSIQQTLQITKVKFIDCFKPYYKWITFNTRTSHSIRSFNIISFKPYYKWITFNTNYKKLDKW